MTPLVMVKDDKGDFYIGALSAGCIVWGILIGTMGLQIPATLLAWTTTQEDLPLGENEKRWTIYFKKEPQGPRTFSGFLVLLRAVANGSTLIYSAWVLPPRDPSKNLNLSKFLLAWLEAPLACLMALACIYSLAMICLQPKESKESRHYVEFARRVRRLGRFSALSSLPYANPAALLAQLQGAVDDFFQLKMLRTKDDQDFGLNVTKARKMKKTDLLSKLCELNWPQLFGLGYVVFSQMVYVSLFACAAVGSVVVKTSQVSFISEKPWHDWTVAEGIQLASFINALSGLGFDPNVVGLVKVLRERYGRYAHLKEKLESLKDVELVASWQRQVIKCAKKIEDPKKSQLSLIMCALTLDLKDCCEIMDPEYGDEDCEAFGAGMPRFTGSSGSSFTMVLELSWSACLFLGQGSMRFGSHNLWFQFLLVPTRS